MPLRDAYDRPFDFPDYHKNNHINYILATSPRSGSTWLASELWCTGALGNPMEYLNPKVQPDLQLRAGRECPFSTYWRWLHTVRSSPNGVFGCKLFPTDVVTPQKLDPNWWPNLQSSYRMIYLARENEVAQAVSYARAVQDGRWFEYVEPQREPIYDFKSIHHSVELIRTWQQFWRQQQRVWRQGALCITYESLQQDRSTTIASIAEFLGVTLNGHPLKKVIKVNRQTDALNHEWEARYRHDLSGRVSVSVPANIAVSPASTWNDSARSALSRDFTTPCKDNYIVINQPKVVNGIP